LRYTCKKDTFSYTQHAINDVIHRSIISLLRRWHAYIWTRERGGWANIPISRFQQFRNGSLRLWDYRRLLYYYDPDYPIHVITAFIACIAMMRKLENLRDLLSTKRVIRSLIFHKRAIKRN